MDLEEQHFERRQLSWTRLFVLMTMVAALAGGGYLGVHSALANAGPKASPWYAPYVDATLTPYFQFQDPTQNVSSRVVLGFVVDEQHATCTPSWGGVYSLDQAAVVLNIDRRMVELHEEGGAATVSFGGRDGVDLASSCATVGSLEAAYRTVIGRYGLRTIDLDDETTGALAPAVVDRRAHALAGVQSAMARHGQRLRVWLTLPAGPSGLTRPGLAEVATMLRFGVTVAGVNSLDEDFGDNHHPVTQMFPAVEKSLDAAHAQLAVVYTRAHIHLDARRLWALMGVTVEIGQNDVIRERFGIWDARQLVSFADSVGIGRVSIWSLNRDAPCPTSFLPSGQRSNTCSGVPQGFQQFSRIFLAVHGAVPELGSTAATPTMSAAHDPFPVWDVTTPYAAGYLVVWHGLVYSARWFNQGVAPDAPAIDIAANPWQLLGPVLTSDVQPTETTLARGTYPAWSGTTEYPQGAKVLFDGLPFVAKYYNVGSSPGAIDVDPQYSPWESLFSVPNEP